MRTCKTILLAVLGMMVLPGTPFALAEGGASYDSLYSGLKGKKTVGSYKAEGVQVYECEEGGWKHKGPIAVLKDKSGKPVAIHHAGANCANPGNPAPPAWETFDGSEVLGAKIAEKANPGAIPSLVLKINQNNGKGSLAAATHIVRANTVGGAAPASIECSPSNHGTRKTVPYTADYILVDNLTHGSAAPSGSAPSATTGSGASSAH